MIWLVSCIGIFYAVFILLMWAGWEKTDCIPANTPISETTTVSVVIPVRNEKNTIGALLDALTRQSFPPNRTEIIVVNDHSTDRTGDIVLRYENNGVRLLNLSAEKKGKKMALQQGIENATGDLIVLTDGDGIVGKYWIRSHVQWFEQYHPVLTTGPVLGSHRNIFTRMQALEMMGLLGSTAGAAGLNHAIMCNGANLSFPRKVYPEIKHIYDHPKTESGDDMFVLEFLKKKYPGKIYFLKSADAVVYTQLQESLKKFFRQRRRWSAKAVFYHDPDILATGFVVLFMNMGLLVSLISGIITLQPFYFLGLFTLKSVADLVLLFRTARFFGEKNILRWFPVVQSLYFFYVCFTLASSISGMNAWKERKIKY